MTNPTTDVKTPPKPVAKTYEFSNDDLPNSNPSGRTVLLVLGGLVALVACGFLYNSLFG